MSSRFLALPVLLVIVLAPIAGRAETFPYDHMHMAAADQAKAVEWYVANLGAKHGDAMDRVLFGHTIFAFAKNDNPLPSVGSVIDHIGLSVPDVDKTVKALEAAGAKVVTPVHDIAGVFRSGSIVDPFGIKIEIVQDPETPGFHHIHLRVPDPEATIKWYLDNFGGERTKLKGQVDGIKYSNPNVWLLVQKAEGLAPSQGHAIDHLGWAVTDVATKVAGLAAKGLKTENPRAARHLTVGFVVSPDGVRIEMVQGRKEEEFVGR